MPPFSKRNRDDRLSLPPLDPRRRGLPGGGLNFFSIICCDFFVLKIVNTKKRIATRVIDGIGRALFALPRLFRREDPIVADQVRSILLIRTAYIGDVVMTLPLPKLLKERFPQAQLTFLTAKAAAPLLANSPYIDEVLCYDPFWFYPTGIADWMRFIAKLRRRRYDLVIEARADIRDLALIVFLARSRWSVSYGVGGGCYLLSHVVPYPGLTHKVVYHLHLASYLGCPESFTNGGLYLTAEEIAQTRTILGDHGVTGPFIAIHPGSRLILKRWYPERFAACADRLIEQYQMPIVFCGAPGEAKDIESILTAMAKPAVSLAGKLPLRLLAACLAEARIFICNDSAPMHISALMGTATVAIFGPSKSIETGPYGAPCRVVEQSMACRSSCDESHCRHTPYHACMQGILVSHVLTAVDQLWQETTPQQGDRP